MVGKKGPPISWYKRQLADWSIKRRYADTEGKKGPPLNTLSEELALLAQADTLEEGLKAGVVAEGIEGGFNFQYGEQVGVFRMGFFKE